MSKLNVFLWKANDATLTSMKVTYRPGNFCVSLDVFIPTPFPHLFPVSHTIHIHELPLLQIHKTFCLIRAALFARKLYHQLQVTLDQTKSVQFVVHVHPNCIFQPELLQR